MSRDGLEELRFLYTRAISRLIPGENTPPSSAQRIALLEELTAIDQDLVEVKAKANASAPLLRLPLELIGEIAAILACIWPPSIRHCILHSSRQKTTIGWLLFTHVCRSLRATLLSIPSLWAQTVQYLGPSGRPALLQRTRSHPLSFSVGLCHSSHTPESVYFMCRSLARARKISTWTCDRMCKSKLTPPTWYLDPTLLSAEVLPFLEEVELQLNGGAAVVVSRSGISAETFRLPPMVAPQLRRLTLSNFYIPFSGRLCSLTYLKLHRSSDHALPEPSQFLDLLRSCSELQELSLSSWIPDISSAAATIISFPRLQKLYVRDTLVRSHWFWTQVDIPPTARQVIAIVVVSSDMGDYIDMIGTGIASKFQLPMQSLLISHDGEMNLAFSDSQVPPLQAVEQIHTAFNRNLDIYVVRFFPEPEFPNQWEDFDLDSKAMAQCIFQHHNLASNLGFLCLWSFDLLINDGPAHEQWRSILLPLTNLHTLYVEDYHFKDLIYPLTISSSDDAPLLPHLRFLWSWKLDLSNTTRTPPRSGPWSGKPHNISTCAFFFEMLSSRARVGKGLERVKIEDVTCMPDELDYVQNAFVPSIHAIVPHFETDEVSALSSLSY